MSSQNQQIPDELRTLLQEYYALLLSPATKENKSRIQEIVQGEFPRFHRNPTCIAAITEALNSSVETSLRE